MLSLVNIWGPCPRDGYRYVFPDDGYLVHAWAYTDWVAAAKQHLQVNNKEIPPTLEADMQHQFCLTLDPGYCLYDDDNRPRPNMSLEWNDVAGGLKTFGRWIAQGMKYVTQAEAERRAAICSRCYLNVNVQGCAMCQKAVKEVIGEKHTKCDPVLKTCAVCKCFLRAKVHFPIDILRSERQTSQQELFPDFCWLKEGGENYRDNDR